MLHLGDRLRNRTVIDSISDEKQTALGVGHFITTRVEYETLDGEPVGRQMFRILKFKPGTGRQAAAAAPEKMERPKRPRPAITLDNKFWFDAAKERRLVIQRCSGCRVLRHPPRPRCNKCGSYEWKGKLKCPRCNNGTGRDLHGAPIVCPTCEGSGKITCDKCEGTGEILHGEWVSGE